MKLKSVSIRNFRCYQEEITIEFNDLTAIIGRNDVGKSSIMDAIEIFLNDGTPDEHDANRKGDPEDLAITCEFDDLPDELVLDDSTPTTLEQEYLVTESGRLRIRKIYSGSAKSPKCTDISAFALHPTALQRDDLLALKQKGLKDRAKVLNVPLDNVDSKINSHLRRAIWASGDHLNLLERWIPLNEENSKQIWTKLRNTIPSFALFKSDRASTDQDPEAQDPLKAAVREALKKKEAELDELAAFVEKEVKSIAEATLSKIREMDPTVASQLNPQFSKPKWDTLFKASITGDDDIPINKRGSGIKRLILLNFFRARAEQKRRDSGRESIIYGIEEPETSQHPHNQRMLMRALEELSIDAQIIVTTHTPMLARVVPENSLRYVSVDTDGKRSILTGGDETNEQIADDLGILPDNTVRLFIGVEGPTDITFLQNISRVLHDSDDHVPDLGELERQGALIFVPLGGSNLGQWVSRFGRLRRPEFYLFDRDAPPEEKSKYEARIEEFNAEKNVYATATNRREIENYLHPQAIRAAYSQDHPDLVLPESFAAQDDVPEIVAKAIHEKESETPWDKLSDKKKKSKESNVKKRLSSSASAFMTAELIDEVDVDGEVVRWLQMISQMLEESS